MTDRMYEDRTALDGRVQQYGAFYQGMRQTLAGEGMPESVRQHAPQYALALTAARDLDRLGKDGSSYQGKVLQLLIAAALAETPLKDGMTPGNPVGDLYQRLVGKERDVSQQ